MNYKILNEAKSQSITKVANKVSRISRNFIDELRSLGKQTLKSNDNLTGLNRSTFAGLDTTLNRSEDLGRVVSQVDDLLSKAQDNRYSFTNSVMLGAENNPWKILRDAKKKVYGKLDDTYNYSGSKLSDIADNEVEESVIRTLARHSEVKEVDDYLKNLATNFDDPKSELKNIVRKVKNDMREGVDPIVMIRDPSGKKRPVTLQVDRPIASYNGSPALNTEKTMGIDGIESFNKEHYKVKSELEKAQMKFGLNSPQAMKAETDYVRSKQFGDQFGEKLRLMSSSSSKQINRAQITLDDLDSYQKIESFLKNPHFKKDLKYLTEGQHDAITNKILANVRNAGMSPDAVKRELRKSLEIIAKDPMGANFMQSLQFKRYSADEMKGIMSTLEGTRNAPMWEFTRAASDAALPLGLGAAAIYGVSMDKDGNKSPIHQGPAFQYPQRQ